MDKQISSSVCTSWRSGAASPRGRGVADPRFHPRRWMLFPEGHGLYPGHGKLGGCVRFFNLSTGAFVRVRLPLFRDHCVLDSVDGILLLQRDQDTAIRLLHPFTGDIAEFPPLETLLPYVDPWWPGNKWGLSQKYLCCLHQCGCRWSRQSNDVSIRYADFFLNIRQEHCRII